MNLGVFSISLAVKDIKASREFYSRLGFEVIDDHEDEDWLLMKNGQAVLGLFQGMFDKNILTWNPTDVRSIQRRLKERDVTLVSEADEDTIGPAHLMLIDPDGNPILIDQIDPSYRPTKPD